MALVSYRQIYNLIIHSFSLIHVYSLLITALFTWQSLSSMLICGMISRGEAAAALMGEPSQPYNVTGFSLFNSASPPHLPQASLWCQQDGQI